MQFIQQFFEGVTGYFIGWTHGAVGQVHVLAALLALFSGVYLISTTKGTNKHRWLGYVYISSMLIVNFSALIRYQLTGSFNFFHAAALASLVTITAAAWQLIRFKRTRMLAHIHAHGALMVWSYYGLVAALIAETVTRALPFMLHGDGGWTRFLIALSIFMLIGSVLTHRYIQRSVFQFRAPQ